MSGSATASLRPRSGEILNNAGIDPAPTRSEVTWSQFLRSQAAVACDFATIETVTLRRFYLLLCIDIATRTVYFAGVTDHPSGVWTTQAARNLLLQYGHQLADAQALVRDRASQFIDAFDEIFRTERMKILKTPVRTPVANALPNAGSPPCDANSSTAPSSGIVASSTRLSSTTSIITTRTGPTVRSISGHPSPPTHQTSQIGASKSLERPAVTDSSTSTEMPPDQPRHSFRHPQGLIPGRRSGRTGGRPRRAWNAWTPGEFYRCAKVRASEHPQRRLSATEGGLISGPSEPPSRVGPGP